MKRAGVIIDMDGTLIDSMPVWEHIGSDYLKRMGVPLPPGLEERLLSMSFEQVAAYFRELGVDRTEKEITAEIVAMVNEKYKNEIPLKDGARELLESLYARGARMCVATASERRLVEAAFARLGVGRYFDFVLTCGEAGSGKDDPKMFLECARRLGFPPERVLVLEDTLYALETAKGAGFIPVGVRDDASKADEAAIRKTARLYASSLRENAPEILALYDEAAR